MSRNLHISARSYLILFSIFTIILTAIRSYQIVCFTDFRTGFYKGPSYLNYCFWILLIIFAIAITFLTYKSDIFNNSPTPKLIMKNKFLQYISLFVGAFSAVYFFLYLFKVKSNTTSFSMPLCILVFILGLLVSTCFIYLLYRMKKTKPSLADILLVAPSFWACSRLANIALTHSILFSIQDNIINVFKTVSVCIFLFCFGKFFVGIGSKNTEKNMIISGTLLALFGICSMISKYVVMFNGNLNNSDRYYYSYHTNILNFISLDFVISIFAIVLIITYITAESKNNK